MQNELVKKPDNKEADYQGVAAFLNDVESVHLIVDEKKYTGEIEQWKLGEAIVFMVSNLDQELVNIPDGFSGVMIKAIGKKGVVRNYQTTIIQRKLPRLLLSFPKKEIARVQREHARFNANISTPLILEKRDHDMLPDDRNGLGTIENVSQGGCSITTQMAFIKGDTVNFFLPVKKGNETKDLDLYGQVMNHEELDNGICRIGLKFVRLNEECKKEIADYMDRRMDAAQAII